ncbi:Adenine nucleotide alpha hydrolases-like superfamily protein [Prunus dulcis]|uniref:Adenine nucleotide alpha hydrolases-like superfamily protein n=1 Tax=Prunus dulcis TaxID=3755 RepID=A0A4Y1RSK0_PRUDU|nr:Adenine nucleotide alpha hydrolases-like superfamily protein [Prunus dulcis]
MYVVALQFVHEMHSKAQKNFDACRDRSLPVFGVGVAFVDESSVTLPPLMKPTKFGDGRERLKKLLDAVDDATGREDLLLHLRMLALQKVASQNGYNRLLLGSCVSRIACHVISATVKGQGYSLPADVQYVDARWEIPVVLPLRDCLAKELTMLCRLDGEQPWRSDFTENNFTSKVKYALEEPLLLCSSTRWEGTQLREENPSRECTIMRTAGKLIPFHFNKIEEIDDSNVLLATRRRQKRYNLKPNESFSSESFCFICNSPLSRSDLLSLKNLENHKTSSVCCSSCQFQILPQDPSSVNELYTLLPEQLFARAKHDNLDHCSAIREQIQDCLLSEGEDET